MSPRSERPRPAGKLAANACPRCGRPMRPHRARLSIRINGESIAVPDSPHLRCATCGEQVFRLDEARRLQEAALDRYRQQHGLLSGTEIRALRRRSGLTQAQLAALLRLGGNTLSRWEAGRNVQSAAMDLLLRLVRDVPETVAYLRDHPA